jgi:hypothetical protein
MNLVQLSEYVLDIARYLREEIEKDNLPSAVEYLKPLELWHNDLIRAFARDGLTATASEFVPVLKRTLEVGQKAEAVAAVNGYIDRVRIDAELDAFRTCEQHGFFRHLYCDFCEGWVCSGCVRTGRYRIYTGPTKEGIKMGRCQDGHHGKFVKTS